MNPTGHQRQIEEIRRICSSIRNDLVLEEGKHYGIETSNLDGACCRAAVDVTWALQQAGFRATVQLATWDVTGAAVHAFTRVMLRDPDHDVLVDITATQFGHSLKPVEIRSYEEVVRRGDWYWVDGIPTTFEYLVKPTEGWCAPHCASSPDGYEPLPHPATVLE